MSLGSNKKTGAIALAALVVLVLGFTLTNSNGNTDFSIDSPNEIIANIKLNTSMNDLPTEVTNNGSEPIKPVKNQTSSENKTTNIKNATKPIETEPKIGDPEPETGEEVYFFYSQSCPHCIREKAFLEEIEGYYPHVKINYLLSSDNRALLTRMTQEHNSTASGVPRTFIKDKTFIGFNPTDCGLQEYKDYNAYLGCKNQIEAAIRLLERENSQLS